MDDQAISSFASGEDKMLIFLSSQLPFTENACGGETTEESQWSGDRPELGSGAARRKELQADRLRNFWEAEGTGKASVNSEFGQFLISSF